MTLRLNKVLTGIAAGTTLLTGTLLSGTVSANGYDNDRPITVYFTRHAEKETTTYELGSATSTYELIWSGEDFDVTPPLEDNGDPSKGKNRNDVCGGDKCAEELNALGLARADLLADWFSHHRVTHKLDAVYSSHKERTRQTVAPTAAAAGLTVQQLPSDGTELEPEGTSSSECLTLDAIANAASGDTLLIAGHSGTLYDIMGDGNDTCAGLGLLKDDDASSNRFPKDAKGKVADFGDIWKVTIHNGTARFKYRVNLQPKALRINNYAY